MAAEPSSSPTSTPMPDPLKSAAKVAKAILDTPTSNGRLVATILSAYDLPDGDVPTSVTMSYREEVAGRSGKYNEVSTGPPAAKHRDHANSFKFGGSSSVLALSAPLPVLHKSTVAFRLTYANGRNNLVSTCVLNKTLRVNDTQWLILNLETEVGGGDGGKSNNNNPESEHVYKSSASRISTSSVDDQPPTLRLKLRLEGPYRPEIAAVINLTNSWFGAVDAVTDATIGTASNVIRDLPEKFPAIKLLLVPTVPLATVAVACAPILVGILVIGLPFFLPLIVILATFALTFAGIGSGLYFSTRDGRIKLGDIGGPAYQTLLLTDVGQSIVYDVGPRPNPQSLAHAFLPRDMIGKLVVSLLVDLVGSSSYLLPGVGEVFDLTWAPCSMVLVGALYDDVMPTLKYVALIEELLPFTDFIPSATMGWIKEFGPGFFEEGRNRALDAKVMARREKEAMFNTR